MIEGYEFCYQAIVDLVQRDFLGRDLEDSVFFKWGQEKIRKGDYFYGAKDEDGVRKRMKDVLDLYNCIKTFGYSPTAAKRWDKDHRLATFPISVRFDAEGRIHVCDGYHRLSILKSLGLVVDVDCIITNSAQALDTNRTGIARGDFPLAEILQELNSGKNIYQPNNDPRCEGWIVWRPDCPERLKSILPEISGISVLDIGSSEGYFSRELSKKGYQVTGFDTDARRIAVARYLATKENQDIIWCKKDWRDLKGVSDRWDTIIMLSVWHHAALQDVDQAIEDFRIFKGRCKKLIIETPLDAEKISWTSAQQKMAFYFTVESFIHYIEDSTGMNVYKTAPDVIGRGMFFFLEV